MLDLHKISLDDNIGIDQQYVDYSKSLKAFSPNIGLIYNLNRNDEVYINYGKSYETPSLSELSANPNGVGFNDDLSPMNSSGFDIGFRKKSQNLSYSIAAFYIDTKDEIVRYELEGFEGMNFYRNLGTSKRVGAELEARYNLGKPGVLNATSGYAGGSLENPRYEDVLTGETGHVEVVKIDYDASEVTFDTLIDAFFIMHDPTTLNRQGPDIGEQYKSVIFYNNDEQKNIIKNKIKLIDAMDIHENPVVTEIREAAKFYPAEDYHQDYAMKTGKLCYQQMYVRYNYTPLPTN